MKRKKYVKPTLEILHSGTVDFLCESGVFNDGNKILDGDTTWENNEEGDGDDAAAKGNWGWNLWED